jgi:hypothetical protein
MKTLWLAITLGLLVPACMTDTDTRARDLDSRGAEGPTPLGLSTASCHGQDACAGTPEATSCVLNCENRHEACLERALDATQECLCNNAFHTCIRGCGQPSGSPQVCP